MRSINTKILVAVFAMIVTVFVSAGALTTVLLADLETRYLGYMSAAARLTDDYRESLLQHRQELDALPRRLIVDGGGRLEALLRAAGPLEAIEHGEDALAQRYDRAGRRDLRRQGFILVEARDGGSAASVGRFAPDGAFIGVRELRPAMDEAALRAIVEQVEAERADPDAMKQTIERAFNDLTDRLLKSDSTERLVSGQETVRTARDALVATVGELPLILIGMAVATIAATILAVTLTTRRLVVKPLIQQTRAIERIAAGDFAHVDPVEARQDEIGALASAVEAFRASSQRVQELEAAQAEERDAAERRRQEDRASIAAAFETSVNRAAGAVDVGSLAILTAAQAMATEQGAAARGSLAVADAAEEATERLTASVASVIELGASVAEVAAQAARSSNFALESVADVDQAAEQITRLNQASSEIHAVSELIRGIARQTNLLALNASIEAARAGDAGRGFAVVAGEVKQLADQTAAATEGIARQIAAIQDESSQAVSAIGRVRGAIHAISDNTTGIAAAVEQQRASADEINRSLNALSDRMGTVTEQIRGVTCGAIMTCANSIEVLWTAEALSETSKALGSDARDFLRSIGAP
jgi:methyl-accepting chemotaxis protein